MSWLNLIDDCHYKFQVTITNMKMEGNCIYFDVSPSSMESHAGSIKIST